MSEQATEALELAGVIKLILAGNDPGVLGAALADLVSIWVAGHHPDQREKVLVLWLEAVRNMIPTQAEELFGPAGWPR
jgi:hypothetical protein